MSFLFVSFQIDPKVAIPPKKLSNKVCNFSPSSKRVIFKDILVACSHLCLF